MKLKILLLGIALISLIKNDDLTIENYEDEEDYQ